MLKNMPSTTPRIKLIPDEHSLYRPPPIGEIAWPPSLFRAAGDDEGAYNYIQILFETFG